MRTQLAVALIGIALCLVPVLGATGSGERSPQEMVYSEGFSLNPGYQSMEPLYAFWDAEGESYFACSLDVDAGYGMYIGYSPEFDMVEEDFSVSFDFVVLAPDWGCYPGIVFQNTTVPDPGQPDGYGMAFYAKYSWSDHIHRKFKILTDATELISDSSPSIGEWYRFTIDYHAASETVDWTVEVVDTGAIFHQVIGADFPIPVGFNRLYIGEITQPPMYGEHAALRIDNIEVLSGETPVERRGWGSIKGGYR